MEIIISAIITAILVVVGFFAGTIAERRHYAQIRKDEEEFQSMLRTNSKEFLLATSEPSAPPPTMVVAETVIASDYFKNFLSSIRKFFGGELGSYHSLMDRARRETMIRLLRHARELGYDALCNVRLETADIGGSTNASVMVSFIGTATAYRCLPVDECGLSMSSTSDPT